MAMIESNLLNGYDKFLFLEVENNIGMICKLYYKKRTIKNYQNHYKFISSMH